MNRHLSPEEFVDALDGTLAAVGRRHLDACDACRRELETIGGVADAAREGGQVPEPSARDWDRLGARVRAATAAESPRRAAWPVAALAAAAGVILAVAVGYLAMRVEPDASPVPIEVVAEAGTSMDEHTVAVMSAIAEDLAPGDARGAVLTPRRSSVDLAVSRLTDAQQRELIRIVQASFGEMEQR